MNALRPAHAVGLRELADELERWSAFAQGAADDGRVAQRQITEHVRRAERAAALSSDILENEERTLAESAGLYERLATELELERQAFALESARLDAALARYETTSASAASLLSESTMRQERLAVRLTTLTHALTSAQGHLHLARQVAETGGLRRLVRGASARAELQRAEAEVHRASDQCDAARVQRHELRVHHRLLSAALSALDDESSAAASARATLGASDEHLARATDCLRRAAESLHDAQERHRDAASLRVQIVADLSTARAALASAAALQQRGNRTYESVQGLATDTGEALRDALTGYGDITREIEHIVLGLKRPEAG